MTICASLDRYVMERNAMNPRPSQKAQDEPVYISASRLERMSVPLTVLHANIQLLQRRIRAGNMPEPESLLRVLEKLEQASRTMADELRQLDGTISTPRAIRENME